MYLKKETMLRQTKTYITRFLHRQLSKMKVRSVVKNTRPTFEGLNQKYLTEITTIQIRKLTQARDHGIQSQPVRVSSTTVGGFTIKFP